MTERGQWRDELGRESEKSMAQLSFAKFDFRSSFAAYRCTFPPYISPSDTAVVFF